MNKLEGFFELNKINLPTVSWRAYKKGDALNDEILWTVRSAVMSGDDFNLPRLIGANSKEAEAFCVQTLDKIGENGLVICYPFFVAETSGTLRVSDKEVVIECVLGDLWNLVTHGRADFSIVYDRNNTVKSIFGKDVLRDDKDYLLSCAEKLRRYFREALASGKSVYSEWSFAFDCDKQKQPVGKRYPVFYELRIIN